MDRKVRIMVVDDLQSMRLAAANALGSEYEVLTCEDGIDACASIADFKPDLVFMDISMPRLDGNQTVAMFRLNPAFANIPVLMMSSKGGVFDIAGGRLLGFQGSIVKPFAPAALHNAIREHLGESAVASGVR